MLFSELYKIMVKKVTFAGFRGGGGGRSLPGSAAASAVAFSVFDVPEEDTVCVTALVFIAGENREPQIRLQPRAIKVRHERQFEL